MNQDIRYYFHHDGSEEAALAASYVRKAYGKPIDKHTLCDLNGDFGFMPQSEVRPLEKRLTPYEFILKLRSKKALNPHEYSLPVLDDEMMFQARERLKDNILAIIKDFHFYYEAEVNYIEIDWVKLTSCGDPVIVAFDIITKLELFEKTKKKFSHLTDDQRIKILADYCIYCGKNELKESKCDCSSNKYTP